MKANKLQMSTFQFLIINEISLIKVVKVHSTQRKMNYKSLDFEVTHKKLFLKI